jgi:hypothetical protein
MALVFLLLGGLGLIGAGAWWLSGYDTKLTGDDPQADAARRGIRCAITLMFASVALVSLLRWALYRDHVSGYIYISTVLPLAITWAGCLSELFARGFQRLLFPEDHRAADLGQTNRALDELASLVRQGKREEAIRLCRQLEEDGNVSQLALETVLSRLDGSIDEGCEGKTKSRELGPGVESLLMPGAPRKEAATEPERAAESVDDMLAQGYLGTAIEILERDAKANPQDFELQMKLAEAHGVHCGNLSRAGKIVERLEADPAFGPEQIQQAKAKLKEWKAKQPTR